MTIKWKPLIISIAIPLLIGGLSALLTRGQMTVVQHLNQPAFMPPESVFPIVWTILFILMGIASYLVYTSNANTQLVNAALRLYAVQLFMNFCWSIVFFNFGWYLFAFIWLVILWFVILGTTMLFYRISKPAAYMLVPYLIWVAFAGYLNLMIFLLNR